MRVVLLSLITLVLTACSKPYVKYVGYWQLEDTKYPKILEIRKEDKDTYLVNENIFQTTDLLGKSKKEQVLEKIDLEGFKRDLSRMQASRIIVNNAVEK